MKDELTSSFYNINNKKDNKTIEENIYYRKFSKKDKNKKLEKFEKFKPKNTSQQKNESSLKGAENKVKLMLSSFLIKLKREQKKDKTFKKNPKIKILISKLSNKKLKLNYKKKKSYTQDKNHLNLNNKNNINNKEYTNEKTNSNITSEEASIVSAMPSINIQKAESSKKPYIGASKLKNNFLTINNNYNDEQIEKSRSKYSSNLSKININIHTSKKNSIKRSSFNTNTEANNSKSSYRISVNDSNNKLKIINKTNENINCDIISKISSYNQLNSYKKNLNLEDTIDDLNSKKSSNRSNNYIGKKDLSLNISKREEPNISLGSINRDRFNNSYLIQPITNNNLINKNKIIEKKFSWKKKKSLGKKIKEDYNLSNCIENKKVEKTENSKRKNNQFNKKDFNINSKNKIYQVESAFKNLQEKIKNSIILRPEDFDSNFNENTHRKKSKYNKEKIIRKGKNFSNKSLINKLSNFKTYEIENNNNDLIKSDIKEKFSSNIKPEKSKLLGENKSINKNNLQIPLPSSDIFKSSDISKNDTESEALKSSCQNATNIQMPYTKVNSHTNITLEKYRILTHKNMVYDSLDDEEVEDEIDESFYINPESNFILIFDGILLFISLYSMLFFPYYLAHNLTFCREELFTFYRIFNIFTEFIYVLDFIFGFFRAYYNFEETLIKKHSSIIKKYLNGWFIFDLIGAIPIYSIIKMKEKRCIYSPQANYYNYILNNINYLLVCNRILKLIKSITYNQAYNFISNILNDYKYYNQINLFLNVCFTLFFFHFTSCIYIFIGRNSYPNWIMNTNLETQNFIHIYICGIYILITALTTVGYGDITCYSLNERIFQLILLVIGIVAYSWIVSNFSNYIKKISEQSADLESRILILDEIKMKNPNLTQDLYDRILRHLKYKKYFEKKDKNIIFESLPVTLKNNLIVEMYKPIIKNFIFFKSFQNTDFIVRVILSFKPILAIKNDILVNEGDIIEDIMFVKKGILTVELPLNMKNPQENIKKYLNMPILKIEKGPGIEKIGNSTLLSEGDENIKYITNWDSSNKTGEKKINSKKIKNQISYVKILHIRENEHFGDVLMFLEQRSPLRVRVRTKKVELFFLKKIDAVNISSSYQNIWQRINKKSVFNFEQIKKSIVKIVELYSSYKTIQNKAKEVNKSQIKRRGKSMRALNCGLKKKNILESVREIIRKKYNSQKNLIVKKEYYELFFENQSSETSSILRIQSSLTLNSILNFKTNILNYNLFDNDNSERNTCKSRKNRNKSLFKDINDKNKKYNDCLGILKKNNFEKNKSSQKSNTTDYSIKKSKLKNSNFLDIKNIEKENNENKNEKTKKEKVHYGITINFINDEGNIEKTLSMNNSSNNILSKKQSNSSSFNNSNNIPSLSINNYSSSNNILENKSNELSFDDDNISVEDSNSYCKNYEINEEIYPGEDYDIPNREETLLNKKISLSYIDNKNKFNNNMDNIHNNSKLKFLLESNKTINEKDFSKYNENLKNKTDINKNTNFNYDLNENKNNEYKLKETKIKKNLLSIESSIKLEVPSLYDNINKISNYHYFNDKHLQKKVKNILLKESQSKIYSSLSSEKLNINLLNSNTKINNLSPLKKRKTISSTTRNNSLKNNNINNAIKNSFSIIKKKSIEFKKRRSVLIKRTENFKDTFTPYIKRSPSFNFNRKLSQKKINNNLRNSKIKSPIRYSKDIIFGKNFNMTTHEGNFNNILNNVIELEPIQKKRNGSLLNKINLNIQKTNLNLNNPDEFYTNYFQSILVEKSKNMNKNEIKKIGDIKLIRNKKDKNKNIKKI